MKTTLQSTIQDVLYLQSYAPDDEVNRVMSSLVHQVVKNSDVNADELATSQQIVKVQHISSETESELEKFWARRIVASEDPQATLKGFPYLENYRELAQRELALIQRSGLELTNQHQALVIGSGP